VGRKVVSNLNLAIDRGSHACHLYETFGEQKEVVLSYFQEGLQNGEHCLYITADQSVDEWYLEFQAYGIDVQSELQRGSLNVINGEMWRQTGDFNSVVKARDAWRLIDGLLANFKGVRIAGDAAWALDPPLPVDQLCHWEATANMVYEGADARAICQYNLNRHSPAAIHSALRTHPIVILDGQSRANPYYEAPRILENEPHLNHSSDDPVMLESMIALLRSFA
jgi:hypothetical protein